MCDDRISNHMRSKPLACYPVGRGSKELVQTLVREGLSISLSEKKVVLGAQV